MKMVYLKTISRIKTGIISKCMEKGIFKNSKIAVTDDGYFIPLNYTTEYKQLVAKTVFRIKALNAGYSERRGVYLEDGIFKKNIK